MNAVDTTFDDQVADAIDALHDDPVILATEIQSDTDAIAALDAEIKKLTEQRRDAVEALAGKRARMIGLMERV